MKDRVVQFPNRYRLTPVSGDVYDLTPEPGIVTAAGTDLNKATLLSDATAAALGLTGDVTVDEAIFNLSGVTIEFITTSKTWVAPANLKGIVHAMLFGGGGGVYWVSSSDYSSGGAGSGYLTEGDVSLTPGQGYSAVIGSGGVTGASPGRGGTTSFAGLSAEGGYPGQKYISGSGGKGGNGGAGGAGIGSGSGGDGQYGGGGACGNNIGSQKGGSGGTYGGGGGQSGIGGAYGGDGASGSGAAPGAGSYFCPLSKWHRMLVNIFSHPTLPEALRASDFNRGTNGGGGVWSLGGKHSAGNVSGGIGGGGGFFAAGGDFTSSSSFGGGGGFFGKGGTSGENNGAGGGGGFLAEGGSGLLSAGATSSRYNYNGLAGAGLIILFYQTEG